METFSTENNQLVSLVGFESVTFHRYADIFCKKIKAANNDKAKGQSKLALMLLWVWVVLSRYKMVSIDPKLKGNSANAKFCEMVCTYPGNPMSEKLLAKFQIEGKEIQKSDSMAIDNINGTLLNVLSNPYQENFMTFGESFKTLVIGKVDDGKIKDVEWPLGNILMPKIAPDNWIYLYINNTLLVDDGYQAFEANVSLHQYVEHDYSLRRYSLNVIKNTLLSAANTNLNHLLQLSHGLARLFQAIAYMGDTYGFCHNDAHLDNVLAGKNGYMVLIDYGRAFFSNAELDNIPFVNELIKQRCGMEIVKQFGVCDLRFDANYLKYLETVGRRNFDSCGCFKFYQYVMNPTFFATLSPENKTIAQEITKRFFLFDLMAISMNVVCTFSRILELVLSSPNTNNVSVLLMKDKMNISGIANAEVEIGERDGKKTIIQKDIINVMSSSHIKNVMYSMYTNNELDNETTSLIKVLLPGICFFSLFVEYLLTYEKYNQHIIASKDEDGIKWYKVDLDKLKGIMYFYFQVSDLLEAERFIEFYKDNKTLYDFVFNVSYKPCSTHNISVEHRNAQTKGGGVKKMKRALKQKVVHKKMKGGLDDEISNNLGFNDIIDFNGEEVIILNKVPFSDINPEDFQPLSIEELKRLQNSKVTNTANSSILRMSKRQKPSLIQNAKKSVPLEMLSSVPRGAALGQICKNNNNSSSTIQATRRPQNIRK